MSPSAQTFPDIHEFLALGGRTRVVAHRGFSGVAPENTLVALRRAIDIRSDMAEIDVTLTRDREVILLHDETLRRTTDGRGRALETDLADIQKLDAGSWFDEEFAGERVPTLGEALDLVRGEMLLNIEIKEEAVEDEVEGGLVDRVLTLVRERDMLDQVMITSFDQRALLQARALDKEVRIVSLFFDKDGPYREPARVLAEVGSSGFNLSKLAVDREAVEACHALGVPVGVYTVNRKRGMRRQIRHGVDAILTDCPDRLWEVLEEDPAEVVEDPRVDQVPGVDGRVLCVGEPRRS